MKREFRNRNLGTCCLTANAEMPVHLIIPSPVFLEEQIYNLTFNSMCKLETAIQKFIRYS